MSNLIETFKRISTSTKCHWGTDYIWYMDDAVNEAVAIGVKNGWCKRQSTTQCHWTEKGIEAYRAEEARIEAEQQPTNDDIYLMIDEQNETDLNDAIEADNERKAAEVQNQLECKERQAAILHRKAKTILREAQGMANNFKDELGVSVHLFRDDANNRFSFDVQFIEIDEYSIYSQHQIVEFLYILVGKYKDLKDITDICDLAENSEVVDSDF